MTDQKFPEAAEVMPGDRISIPGMFTEPRSVEDVRIVPFDEDIINVEITVWPDVQAPEFPAPADAREYNFGHFYAQFMVTLTLTDTYPIIIH